MCRDGKKFGNRWFTVCQKKLLQFHEVPADTEVALRTGTIVYHGKRTGSGGSRKLNDL